MKLGLYLVASIILIILILNVPLKSANYNQREEVIDNLYISEVIPHNNVSWIINPQFNGTGQPWYSSVDGDTTDGIASISPGQANYGIMGDARTFSDVSGIPQYGEWKKTNHSVRTPPLNATINQYGCNVTHVYDEDSSGPFPNSGDQTALLAGILWKRNFTLPVDMSDYIINSASISAMVNGSADQDIETRDSVFWDDLGGDLYESLNDHVIFYVEISDVENRESYPIASYRTDDLGNGSAERRDYNYNTRVFLNDTYMTPISEVDLIYRLTQILQYDNHNFTITLGMDIDCEDNYYHYELDVWYSLLIKSCDLTFTYVKKMDRSTSVSWNQVGNELNGTNVKVTNGNLRFKYKIDQPWPTSLSRNSEIRILINNRQHSETKKLGLANTTYQEVKIDGYDVTDIIYPYENVTLSIQVFLAEEFGLNQSITVSITDVYLYISYTETIPEVVLEPWIFTTLLIVASIIATGVGSYLVAYQKVLKYPRPVRKVRKFRKTLKRKRTPNVIIFNRERAFRRTYSREISGSIKLPKTKPVESTLPEKLGAEPVEPTLEPEEIIAKSIEKKAELDKLVKNSAEEVSKK